MEGFTLFLIAGGTVVLLKAGYTRAAFETSPEEKIEPNHVENAPTFAICTPGGPLDANEYTSIISDWLSNVF